jgi:hypothetical protein
MATATDTPGLDERLPAPEGWQASTVCFTELRRAWSVLHRAGAPELSWEQRLLVLTGLFDHRPSAWVVALEARLRALEAQTSLIGKPPDEDAFRQAAQARLQARDTDFQFAPGSFSW